MPEIKPGARVIAIESECDEVEQKWTITVARSFAESPNVLDLPDDIQRALMAWMLQHIPQRVVMGFPEGWRDSDPGQVKNGRCPELLTPGMSDGKAELQNCILAYGHEGQHVGKSANWGRVDDFSPEELKRMDWERGFPH